MKKQMILILLVHTGGFALPVAAQNFHHRGCEPEIIITGYRLCGSPVYAKRMFVGRCVRIVPVSTCEVQRYLERQRWIAGQRAYQRQVTQVGFRRAQCAYAKNYYRYLASRRCR